jgi:uncharacterized SAM-binding protein YcdF (DUF218 family)
VAPGRRRWPARAGLLVAAVAAAYLGVTLDRVLAAAEEDQARPAGAIVVLGSAVDGGVPAPDLAARLSHALDLYHRRLAPVIVVTGGREPGDEWSEAAAAAVWLDERGVPAAAVVPVVHGRNTWQSLTATAKVLRDRGIRSVLLVSDPFHDERITLMSRQLGLTPWVSPTRTSPLRGPLVVPYFAKETVEVAVGRLVGFGRLSSLTHG